MKNCNKCGQTIPEDSKFCSFCGEVCEVSCEEVTPEDGQVYDTTVIPAEEPVSQYAPRTENPNTAREEEQKHLNSMNNRLKWERIAWKVQGIILLVLAIIFMLISVIGATVGIFSTATSVSSDDGYYYEEYDDGIYYYDYEDDYSTDMSDFGIGVAMSVFGVYITIGAMFLAIAIVNLVMAKKVGKYRKSLYTDCTDALDHSTSVGSIVMGAIFNEYALIAIIINFIVTKKNIAIFERIKANQTAYNAQFTENK